MRVGIAAGGTGGHLFPAWGFYEALMQIDNQAHAFFVVSTRDREITQHWHVQKYSLHAIGFPRKISFALVTFLIYLVRNFISSLTIIAREKPEVIIGFGGYVSVAPLLAAVCMRVPVVIHEQNVVPGRVNRMLSHSARLILTGLKGSLGYWPKSARKKVVFTGIPIREQGRHQAVKKIFDDRDLFTVLIMGGSQGAQIFNMITPDMLKELQKVAGKIRFIHLTGRYDSNKVEADYEEYGFEHRCFNFYHDMGDIYAAVDIALCRAGAGTLSELAFAGIPAIVVPYPYATDNHQFHNAKVFSTVGAVELIEEKECSAHRIAERILYYYKNKEAVGQMRGAMRAMAVADAGDKIVGAVKRCLGKEI